MYNYKYSHFIRENRKEVSRHKNRKKNAYFVVILKQYWLSTYYNTYQDKEQSMKNIFEREGIAQTKNA